VLESGLCGKGNRGHQNQKKFGRLHATMPHS
jgi:hypothetical protein